MRASIRSLDYRHPGARSLALNGASLEIEPGAAVGLLGPNGAGKSTLVACLMGFLKPCAGRVTLDGMPPRDLRVRARTGWLAERPVFPSGMSARKCLAFHHALLGRTEATRDREVAGLLDRVGLGADADRRPSRYSLGMRQRLGLACALLGDPDLLLLDEPATGVDPSGVALLREELRAARARGATIVVSSHQLDEIERTCDRIAFMQGGAIVHEAGVAELAGRRVVLRFGARPEDPAALDAAVSAAGGSLRARQPDGACVDLGAADIGTLVAALVQRGFVVRAVTRSESPLEQLFRQEATP